MHPIFIYITENFYIGTYGVFVALGVFAGIFTAVRRARTVSIPDEFVFDLTFYMIIAGIVGSRLLFIIINWKLFLEDPLGMILSREGFVFLGGFAAATFTGIIFIKKKKYPFLVVLDTMAVSVPLGHFFGRLGCFSAGCCYGKICSHGMQFLGVSFPAVVNKKGELIGSYPYIDQLNSGLIEQTSTSSLPVFPTQLIEALLNIIIFIVLHYLYKRRKFDGYIVALYLILYSVGRFLIEFLRGDVDRKIWLNLLSTSQILSIIAVSFGLYIFISRKNKPVTSSLQIAEEKKNNKTGKKK